MLLLFSTLLLATPTEQGTEKYRNDAVRVLTGSNSPPSAKYDILLQRQIKGSWAVGVYQPRSGTKKVGWVCDDALSDTSARVLCSQILGTKYGSRAPSGALLDDLPFVLTWLECTPDNGSCTHQQYGESVVYPLCDHQSERAAVWCYDSNNEWELTAEAFATLGKGKITFKFGLRYTKHGERYAYNGSENDTKGQISMKYCGRNVKIKAIFGNSGRYKLVGKATKHECSDACWEIYIGEKLLRSNCEMYQMTKIGTM